MREESHLDDMRAAIRGDFERLASRRGGQELMKDELPEAEPEPEEAEPPAPNGEPPVPTEEPELQASGADDVPETDEAHGTEEPPRRGLFARLLGL